MLKLSLALLLVVGLVHSAPTVDNSLLRTLQSKGQANIIISLNTGSTSEVLNKIQYNTFADRGERLTAVAEALKIATAKSQADLLTFIQNEKSNSAIVTGFWITNKVSVRHADLALVQKLTSRSDISEIREELVIQLDDPIDLVVDPVNPLAGEQWGVTTVRAPEVWARGHDGKTIVVSNVDTGVRGTHEALKSNFRSDHGWFDPEGGSSVPTDNNGHGTHTMGTIAGVATGVGVAPGAQWIACVGCATSSCSEFALVSCGQFIACPTDTSGGNPECGKAPHLVSNSWGGGQGTTFYNDVIATWRAAGIHPFFSQGNSGNNCGTANSPGDNPDVIGVGSTVEGDTLSSFSSVGPTISGLRKPDVAAPGSNVYSSYITSDTSYAFMSGTSMACPHAAGVAALLLHQNPNLTFAQLKETLEYGSKPVAPNGKNCGGISDSTYPNNNVGSGRLDVADSHSRP